VVLPNVLPSGVPKVPKGCSEGFCHFWHLLTLGILESMLLGKGAERRMFQRKGALD
jgi:hypothetical protein